MLEGGSKISASPLPVMSFLIFEKGFHAVNQYAVSEEGVVGWVQGVADRPGKTVKESSKDYAVGYYLMICSEWIQYCEKCEKNK